MTKDHIVVATWWTGVVLATIALLVPFHRADEIDVTLTSPFDNTRSGHAEQWIFLSEAAPHVPDGTSFTVIAPDRETEMSLFMMAVGLVPQAAALPTSYYGRSTSIGGEAHYLLEFDNATSGRTLHPRAIRVTGGWVERRMATER